MMHEWRAAPATYPTLTLAGADALIGRAALSGLTADPEKPDILGKSPGPRRYWPQKPASG